MVPNTKKRVMFADAQPCNGAGIGKLLNVVFFDKNEVPVACNPSPMERQRVAALATAIQADPSQAGANSGSFTPNGRCRAVQVCQCQLAAKPNSKAGQGNAANGTENGFSSMRRASQRPASGDCSGIPRTDQRWSNGRMEQTGLPAFPNMKAVNYGNVTGGPRNCVVRRKIRSLWFMFSLKSEAECELWRSVALASVTYDERPSVLSGKVRVINFAFQKEVFVRYTIDNWGSFRDIPAIYESSSETSGLDMFSFSIPIPINIPHGPKIAFALCYRVAGQEHWDNNDGVNYEGRVVYSVPSPTVTKKSPNTCAMSMALVPPPATGIDSPRQRQTERANGFAPCMWSPPKKIESPNSRLATVLLSPNLRLRDDPFRRPFWALPFGAVPQQALTVGPGYAYRATL